MPTQRKAATKPPTRSLSLRISNRLFQRIVAEADKSGGSISEVIRLALVRHLLPEDKKAAA